MTPPLVSVITPTANRPEMLWRCREIFERQDYPNKEWIFISNEHPECYRWPRKNSIGYKRNIGCSRANGSIIIHMDDDDLYATDYITQSVAHLINSGAEITGLSNAYFYDATKKQTYELRQDPKAQLVICGATLCYHRRAWERKPFPDTNYGEDMAFIQNNGRYECHGYKEGFTAIVHGNNTVCHKSLPLMHKVNTTPQLVLDWRPR